MIKDDKTGWSLPGSCQLCPLSGLGTSMSSLLAIQTLSKRLHPRAPAAVPDTTETERPGGLSLITEAGGLGSHLSVVSCTLLIIGRIIGTGIFSTPPPFSPFGTMFPKSSGEKVVTASGCIVFASKYHPRRVGKTAMTWSERGIALGVIFFVTILHGLTPQTGVRIMNILTAFKITILVFIVVSGWVVLSGRTSIQDPHANFRNAFVGSSTSSNS
ncbi:hypothetical protein EDC04DRAFT_2879437, partial [Pisolithus marmoratus]